MEPLGLRTNCYFRFDTCLFGISYVVYFENDLITHCFDEKCPEQLESTEKEQSGRGVGGAGGVEMA